ncbi:SemiSWEET family sugar transporter [Mariniflexile ostreae]|uniref:SemiSWEET family sugar transporter n=1 Tax=Mariniflexile ostreae TaxID=1520892 RepID=A0ABV5FAY3_9FLAO
MALVDTIGVLAGIFTTVAVLPQIIKALKTKKVADVSPFMFLILCLGVGLWTVYGVLKKDWPIIITNGISFIFNGVMLYICITSQHNQEK